MTDKRKAIKVVDFHDKNGDKGTTLLIPMPI